ncbi:MAG TPA: YCF48-related protein [Myxococcaceae bacterium]|nr:YCF48-related protein [Myxococcaceae bacterium]
MRQTSGTSAPLYGVSFVNANTGTAVGGSGTILRTMDGGTTWTSQRSVTQYYLMAVSFVDANTGTAVGEYGSILRTTGG